MPLIVRWHARVFSWVAELLHSHRAGPHCLRRSQRTPCGSAVRLPQARKPRLEGGAADPDALHLKARAARTSSNTIKHKVAVCQVTMHALELRSPVAQLRAPRG
jgi:hypothetical protein